MVTSLEISVKIEIHWRCLITTLYHFHLIDSGIRGTSVDLCGENKSCSRRQVVSISDLNYSQEFLTKCTELGKFISKHLDYPSSSILNVKSRPNT